MKPLAQTRYAGRLRHRFDTGTAAAYHCHDRADEKQIRTGGQRKRSLNFLCGGNLFTTATQSLSRAVNPADDNTATARHAMVFDSNASRMVPASPSRTLSTSMSLMLMFSAARSGQTRNDARLVLCHDENIALRMNKSLVARGNPRGCGRRFQKSFPGNPLRGPPACREEGRYRNQAAGLWLFY